MFDLDILADNSFLWVFFYDLSCVIYAYKENKRLNSLRASIKMAIISKFYML